MKYYIILFLTSLYTTDTFSQNIFKAIIKDKETKEALLGVTAVLLNLNNGAGSDANGMLEIKNIPDGRQTIMFSYLGYQTRTDTFIFPLSTSPVLVFLSQTGQSLGEIVVQSARSRKRVEDIPSKIDVVSAEDIEEKSETRTANLTHLFNESTGVTTQQTSALSGAANIRIQGLDGQYTQLLKDGMPLYEGFSEGLSINQIAPVDLKQVEFVKGSASTLYGGGAIAGLVNLITKTPEDKRELTFLLSGNSAGGGNASEFYSQRWSKTGVTLFSAYNYSAAYDPANIGLSAIPKTNTYTVNPKMFFYFDKKNTVWAGINTTYDDRFGGDMNVIAGNTDSTHRFFERDKTLRTSSQLEYDHKTNDSSKIVFKNSVGLFDRKILETNSSFDGQQISSFSELNYSHERGKMEWVAGINLWTINFNTIDTNSLKYNLTTFGVFAQNDWKVTKKCDIETGLRLDENTPATNNKLKGFFILPRINALWKFDEHWSYRLGGGLGYKMPSPFDAQSEQEGYNYIQPISFSKLDAVTSYGANTNVIFKTTNEEMSLVVDQLFFYTRLDNPFELDGNRLDHANGYLDTRGTETNIKIGADELYFWIGYTYTDALQHFSGNSQWQPLTPRHLAYIDLSYEEEKKYRISIEADYKSEQLLDDGTTGRGYIMLGLLIEKYWQHISVFINAENLTDSRQTRWGSIYTGTITSPVFKDIYAPLDGRVFNAGIKLKL